MPARFGLSGRSGAACGRGCGVHRSPRSRVVCHQAWHGDARRPGSFRSLLINEVQG
ncbi:hypothetical protein C731_0522 [Mycolicibacterium hassiacum DSM 44199]|uniref:Uncharacterized protein n=1 Tax=Mycolicibacterium hassiacum (strain DSM 44199 / CIP 105218 / JCM 12690 / 3849) TaxID=1122247 RepID=K5BKT2_MYCHD|nr:hypothetical protein C731_0522 [Mycolicibacterium hassiacum DSM 44199]